MSRSSSDGSGLEGVSDAVRRTTGQIRVQATGLKLLKKNERVKIYCYL